MPNWCNNTLNISHEDPAMIVRAKDAFAAGKFLQEFVPCPAELLDQRTGSYGGDDADEKDQLREELKKKYGYDGWYSWQVANWGTKWDVGGDDGHMVEQDANGVVFNFDSAWAPPVAAYETLEAMGFKILAYYFEPGMAFCGRYSEGSDDYYEYAGMTSNEIADELPDDLDETFGISEQVAEWEAEQEEEQE